MLATIEDVENLLEGKKISAEQRPRAEAILRKLSADFKACARQTFEPVAYEHRLKVNGGQALPNRSPVVSVATVTDDDGNSIPFKVARGTIRVSRDLDFIIATYTAGLPEVPTEVRDQIADSARRVLSILPIAAQGVTQHTESAGPFSDTYQMATWAVGGQALLSPDDIAVAKRYRPRRRGNVWRSAP